MIVISRLLRFCACRAAKIVAPSLRRNKTCSGRMDNAADSEKIKRQWGFGATGLDLPGLGPAHDFAMQQWANHWALQDF
jgi:hypothetical protein